MNVARSLIAVGSIIFAAGLLMYAYEHVPFVGKLKGDILIDQGSFRIYIPLTSSIIISLFLSIIFNIFK